MIFIYTTNVKSQLQVDSTGYVGIGITDEVIAFEYDSIIHSPFNVCTVGIPDAIANFQSFDRQYTLTSFTDRGNQSGDGTAIWSVSWVHDGNSEGVVGNSTTNSLHSNYSIGVRGEASSGYNTVGVYGGKYAFYTYHNFAGIYGTTNSGSPSFQYPGSYAGYFVGTVRATGPMYAQAFYTPSANSSGGNNEGTTINAIRGEERVTEKLRNVSSFELEHYEQRVLEEQPSPADKFLKGRGFHELSKKEILQLDSIRMKTIPAETDPLASVNYGLDAEQLKAMFPKLVQQDIKGNYSINYIEMIPLLVKGINELSEELEELKGTSRNMAKAQSETTGIDNSVSDVDMVRMDQNKPNPFSESTVIGLNIPEKTLKANIFIYDLSGKQVKNEQISERGETNITVYASELGAGMYIYTLVVDGKVVVTRKMIVSEN